MTAAPPRGWVWSEHGHLVRSAVPRPEPVPRPTFLAADPVPAHPARPTHTQETNPMSTNNLTNLIDAVASTARTERRSARRATRAYLAAARAAAPDLAEACNDETLVRIGANLVVIEAAGDDRLLDDAIDDVVDLGVDEDEVDLVLDAAREHLAPYLGFDGGAAS